MILKQTIEGKLYLSIKLEGQTQVTLLDPETMQHAKGDDVTSAYTALKEKASKHRKGW